MKTAKILWYYFSGWGFVIPAASALIVGFSSMVMVGAVTQSSEATSLTGLVGAILGIVAAAAYTLHVDRREEDNA